MHPSGALLTTGFWDANPSYNATNFALAIFGLLLTIVGFIFTIKTLFETKTAATAAKEATEETRQKMGEFAAFIDMKTLGSHAREVSSHLLTGNLQSVTLRSGDLRDGVARARASLRTKGLMAQGAWQETIQKIVSVHELSVQCQNEGRQLTGDENMECSRLINEVADEFHRLSALVETKI